MTLTSNANKQRDRFINLLRELFQLNQPDLDFGLYRIMHAKSAEIEKFLTEDLLAVIATSFGGNTQANIDSARAAYENALATAKSYGAADPENAQKVQEVRAAYEVVRDGAGDDADIYDHLYRFFERYYDQGDFLSRRYYARETHDRAAPYSVPYDGSEVYLHWANKDQYYIKTSESFNNYSIDISKAKDGTGQTLLFGDHAAPRKLHFKLVDAEEGEHNNVKAASDKDRYFLLDATPIAWQAGDTGTVELVVRFQYRADDEKTGTAATWRDKRNALSVEAILAALTMQAQSGDTHAGDAEAYHRALAQSVTKGAKKPTGKQETQPLLARYLHQYTAKNTMDYFIHKDLGGFLKRELDFYIKNEVMHLDDLGTADAPHVANYEKYLKKLHTLRSIAQKLITFLAQIEDFQKKLWLKKKFVIDTQWLVTLDKVPVAMYAEVAANAKQWAEWKQLGFLVEPAQDLLAAAVPGTVEYLKTNTALVLDTQFFDAGFTARLLASIENLDEATDGVLVHSENFQALNLMQERYREQVKCIYIDPPYNTGDDGFNYKDGYKSSSWISLLNDRVRIGRKFNTKDGVIFASVDDKEVGNLDSILSLNYGTDVDVYPFIWHLPRGINAGHIAKAHEYILPYFVNRASTKKFHKPANLEENSIERCNKKIDRRHPASVINFPAGIEFEGNNAKFENEIPGSESIKIVSGSMIFEDGKLKDPVSLSAGWTVKNMILSWLEGKIVNDSKGQPIKRFFFKENGKLYYEKDINTYSAKSVISGIADTQDATSELLDFFQNGSFSYPKPHAVLKYLFELATSPGDIVMDYFSGSGTTAHATIKLNRADQGRRKYILVEQGFYFDSVLKPRINKVIYSSEWVSGQPTINDGVTHLVKIVRLEAYEDTLNNLRLVDDTSRQQSTTVHQQLREDYFLNYLLALETEGSPSLLNVTGFADPTAYQLDVKRPGSDAHELRNVDLLETFNWLIGLRVDKLHAPQTFSATFAQEVDSDLPSGSATRLLVKGKLKEVIASEDSTELTWWFRSVEGRVPSVAGSLIDQRVLVLWRKLSGDLEQDNAVLDAYLREVLRLDLSNSEDKNQFDIIYVNGSHTLPKMPHCDIRLLEQTFHQRMWESQDV